MQINLIKTKKDYQQALARLEVIFDARPSTAQSDELGILSMLIEKYENKHFTIEFPDTV
jgi:HTH-type transcriptional regulator/antitoxin HigA